MCADQLHHKRKARKANEFRRNEHWKKSNDLVLIVCEGEKTEPLYFEGLRKELRLGTANIRIVPSKDGTDPGRIVSFAIKLFNDNRRKTSLSYDRVYCVFDKDKHATYDAALDKMRGTSLGKNGILRAITSIPCFEVWMLLHYKYTTRAFCVAGNGSDCDEVVSELKKHIPGYAKGSTDIYETIKDMRDMAIKNAKQLEGFHKASGANNPSTKVHELVEYLKGLKSKKSMFKKHLLIFDLDGTLIDSSSDIAAAANMTIESMGYARRGVGEIKADIGWGVKTLLERLMPDEPPERIEAGRRLFLDFYGAHLVVDTHVYPGVRGTLEHFKALGKKMAVVTNKPVALAERVLSEFNLRGYFLAVIGGDSFANRKPHPEPVEAALKAAGVGNSEAVLVGDSPIDCEAGAAAFVQTIGVGYGFRAREELVGCAAVIDKFDELKNIVS